MTDWQKSSRCESASCAVWRVHDDGDLELGDTEQPGVTLRLSRRDALTLIDAARRGEVYPPGR